MMVSAFPSALIIWYLAFWLWNIKSVPRSFDWTYVNRLYVYQLWMGDFGMAGFCHEPWTFYYIPIWLFFNCRAVFGFKISWVCPRAYMDSQYGMIVYLIFC